jgi:hypothetical protein
LNRELDILPEVRQSLSEPFRKMIPRAIGTGRFRGQLYSAMSWLPGVSLAEEKGQIPAVLREVCGFVADLTANTRQPCESWRDLIHAQAKSAAAKVLTASEERFGGFEDLSSKLDAILELLWQGVPNKPGFGCALHGDFWPGNVLVESGHVCGVHDWDWFQPHAAPAIDLICFLAWELGNAQNWRAGNEFVQLYKEVNTPSSNKQFVANFISSLGIDKALLSALIVLAWLHSVGCVLSDPDMFLAKDVMRLKLTSAADYFSGMERLGLAKDSVRF